MQRLAFLATLGCSSLLTLALGACDQSSAAKTDDVSDRGGLGKTDLVGSCELEDGSLACGAAGTGNCWCDEACSDFGDCCSDAGDVCGVEVPRAEGVTCGGLLGTTCDEGFFCYYEEEAQCGAGDQTGVCLPEPEVCIEIYSPVCGCDGETYANSCKAAAAGTSIASEGECGAEACDPDQFCTLAPTCVDGQLYPTGCGPTNCDEPLGPCADVDPTCDPTLLCGQALSCVDGQLYPTTCGPANCDEPLGPCPDVDPPACDPTLVCGPAETCIDGQLYPTTCGPANCDEPIATC